MADETQVVLTANTAPYERSIDQAAQSTNRLLDTVVKLTTAIDGAFKSAGRTMQIGGAGMVASVTAAGFAAGRLEHQMSQLQASMTMAAKAQDTYVGRMNDYTKTVTGLRTEFGMTSQEAIALSTQLNKLGQSSRNVGELARNFTQLSAVTGEGVGGLVDGMIQLQRSMGTENVRATKVMSTTLAELSQNAGVSATGILQFSQAIVPVAKLSGMTQKEIMGVSTAFLKSGQDGYAAASAFNKMLTDITRTIQYGSPEIATYANLIGVSVEQFKAMPRTEAITQIFEAINAQGPQALKTLERMGLDGVRSLKAIQGVAQAGGIRGAIYDALGGGTTQGQQTFETASERAFDGLNDQMKKIAENAKMIGEAFGQGVLPVLTGVARAINTILTPMTAMMQMLKGIPGGAALLAGAGLLAAGTVTRAFTGLSTLGLATGAYRTIRGGFRFGAGMDMNEREQAQARSYGRRQLGLPAEGNWVQQALYGGSARVGAWRAAAAEASLGERASGGIASGLRRAGIYGIQTLGGFLGAGLAPLSSGAWDNNMNRDQRYQMFQSARARDSFGWGQARYQFDRFRGMMGNEQAAASAASMARFNTGLNTAANSTAQYSSVTRALIGETRQLASAMGQAAGTTMRMGAIGTGRVLGAGMGRLGTGLGALASSAWGMAGGGLGIGLMGGLYAYGKVQEGREANEAMLADRSNLGPQGVYATALGEAAAATKSFADVVKEQTSRIKETGYQAAPTGETIERVNQTRNAFTFAPVATGSKAELTAYGAALRAGNASPAQLESFYEDLLRRYGTGPGGVAQAQEIMNASRGRVNMGALFGGAYEQGDLLKSPGDFFRLNERGRGRAAAAGATGQQLMAATGNSGQQAQVGINALNQLAAETRKRKWGPFLSQQGSQAAALGYVKMIMGDSGTQQDVDAVVNAMTESGGDVNRMRQILAQSGTRIGDNVEQMTRQVQQMGGNVTGTEMPTSAFYMSSFRAAGMDQATLNKMLGIQPRRLPGQPAPSSIAPSNVAPVNRLATNIFGSTTTDLGRSVLGALGNEADMNKQYQAMTKVGDAAIQTAGSFAGATEQIDQLRAAAGAASAALSQMLDAARSWVRQRQAEAMQYMSTPERGAQLRANMEADRRTALNFPSEKSEQQAEESRRTFEAFRVEQKDRLRAFAMQVREFNVARQRGEEDFNRQMTYAFEDYNRQRTYAEEDFARTRQYSFEDFNRQRKYAEADFARNQRYALADYARQRKYSYQDFNRTRLRSEEDFNTQVVRMSRDAAKTITNIYERLNVERTWSASNLLQNMADQQARLTEMQANLERLRGAGLTNASIGQMGLNDPNNMQQLARLTDEIMANPELVRQFNSATSARAATAKAIVQDKANTQWTDMLADFNKNMRRSEEDFDRAMARQSEQFNISLARNRENFGIQMTRSREAFDIQLARSRENFDIGMARQAEQFQINVDRMHHEYNLSVQRAGDDLNRSMEEITNNFNDLATIALSTLTGTSYNQMKALLKVLGTTRTEVKGVATSLVKDLNGIFVSLGISAGGVLTLPNGGKLTAGSSLFFNGQRINAGWLASGGEVPGYSPHKRADNIPVHATAGEYVQPVDSVEYYGKGFMDALKERKVPRGAVQGLADGGMVYQQLSAWAAKNLPGLHVTSGYRPGAITALGNVSNHAKGLAIDLAPPSMTAFNKIKGTFGTNILQLFYSPAGGQQVLNGKNWYSDPVTRADHWDHIHWAMRSLIAGGALSSIPGWDGSKQGLIDLISGKSSMKRFNKTFNRHPIRTLGIYGGGWLSKLMGNYLYESIMQGGGGGVDFDYKGSVGSTSALKTMVQTMAAARGWTGSNWTSLDKLIQAESSWNPRAQNPTSSAYGLFQFLNSTWATVGGHKTSDPKLQTTYGLKYIGQRYGSPSKAWSFWNSHTPHWYGDGALFDKPSVVGLAEKGPEAVLPLNAKGVEFMFQVMKKNSSESKRALVAAGGVPQPASTVSYYQRIDKSTTISGPITVQSQDPDDMLRKIDAKKRMEALKGRH